MKKNYSRFRSVVALLILTLTALLPSALAQTAVTSTRVLSDPAGPWFVVDGSPHSQAFVAFWPVGSSHTLLAPTGTGVAYNIDQTIKWLFLGWQWAGGAIAGNPINVIASPSITEYKAMYSAQYLFQLKVSCAPDACPDTPGVILVNGQAVSADQATWQSPGSALLLQAFPNSGYIFNGWQEGPNQTVSGFQNNVVMGAPVVVEAVFRPTKSITFLTEPPSMKLYADRTTITTPYTMTWGQGTDHTLGGIEIQPDNNNDRWVFDRWSDGGAFSHTYVVGRNSLPETIIAKYTRAAYPSFITMPSGLNLVVDGLTLPPPYTYIWGVGQLHKVVAPVTQTDSKGNQWNFKQWSDNVTTPARDIVVPAGSEGSFNLIAIYTAQARLTVGSSVAGLTVAVDGKDCVTPCSIVRDLGARVRVSAPASVKISDSARQDFLGWSASGAPLTSGDWVATLDAPTNSVTATYHLMNRLSTAADPPEGASWSILPAASDGFYDSQALVSLAVTARPGYRFGNWSGDLSGALPNASLTMSVPHAVEARLSRVPYIAPTGVSNGAGPTPQPGVAPGSVVSIFGASLASATALGPESPLVQTLAGTVVHLGNRLLPLYFVSPAQVNLQLPPDLATGVQTLTVSSQGMPDVSSPVSIVRNAPGLFPLWLNDQSYALVLHEDGSLVTPYSRARTGELMTLFGTGFGPTDRLRPEGFAVPSTPPYLVLDPVVVQVGERLFPAERAFAAPGRVGIDLAQFRLDSGVPSGTTLALHLTINGVDSNSLQLPIQ